MPSAVGMAVAGTVLLLLSLCLSARCPPITPAQCWGHAPVPSSDHQPTVPEPPGPQVGVLVGAVGWAVVDNERMWETMRGSGWQ